MCVNQQINENASQLISIISLQEEPFLDAEEGAILREEVTDEVVMASQVDIDASKKVRTTKRRIFNKKVSEFKEQVGKDFNVLKAAYEEIVLAYSELDIASDEYYDLVEGEVVEVDYMTEPYREKSNAQAQLQDAEFAVAQGKLKSRMTQFQNDKPSDLISKWCSEKSIGFSDLRKKLAKVEAEYAELKQQHASVVEMNPTADLRELDREFKSLVMEEYSRCEEVGFAYLQADVPQVQTSSSASEPRISSSSSNTKKETVKLPKFSGDEKTAYKLYPVWRKQWDSHIMDYEEKSRSTMLLDHLDKWALEQIVGYENEYVEAMEKLDSYYGNKGKVVKACLEELHALPRISGGDYKALVSYMKCIKNNHARLKAAGLEHEISNTTAMSSLVNRLPYLENDKWQSYRAGLPAEEEYRLFPAFLKWLEQSSHAWEQSVADGRGRRNKDGKATNSFFGDMVDGQGGSGRKCYICGEEGHIKKDCSQNPSGRRGVKSSGGGSKGSNSGGRSSKDRAAPVHRKYHCAFHKDDSGTPCFTETCPVVRFRPEYEERLKLLQANGDCEVCCGDCPKGRCSAKNKRTCGGPKGKGGCGANHVGHEYFCKKAKVVFSRLGTNAQTVTCVL